MRRRRRRRPGIVHPPASTLLSFMNSWGLDPGSFAFYRQRCIPSLLGNFFSRHRKLHFTQWSFGFSSLGQNSLSNSEKAQPSDVLPERGSWRPHTARQHGEASQSSAGTTGFSLAGAAEGEPRGGRAREAASQALPLC